MNNEKQLKKKPGVGGRLFCALLLLVFFSVQHFDHPVPCDSPACVLIITRSATGSYFIDRIAVQYTV